MRSQFEMEASSWVDERVIYYLSGSWIGKMNFA